VHANLLRRFGRERNGAVLVVVALLLFVLVGAIALSVDLGRAWNLDTQLQDAADACALAGASQLDANAGSRQRAIEACADQVLQLVENRQSFATDAGGAIVQIDATVPPAPNPDIIFWSNLGDPALGLAPVPATNDTDASFIQVTVRSREVNFFFAAAVGAVSSATPDAIAVAGLTSAKCQVPPMMICNPFDDGTNPAFDFAVPPASEMKNTAIILDHGASNGSWTEGNFGLLSVSSPGAAAIRDAMCKVNPDNACFGQFVSTKTGQVTAIRQGLNCRFDMYDGAIGSKQNDEQYIPARNTVKGLMKTADPDDCAFSGGGWYHPPNRYEGPTVVSNPPGLALKPERMGYPRDKCQYAGNCSIPGNRFGDFPPDWDYEAYIEVNHPGMDPDPSAFPGVCGTCGLPGGMPSRYEVYEWEKIPGNEPWTGPGPEDEADATTVCNTQTPVPDPPDPDRRLLVVAVVNCISPIHNCDPENGESPELLNCEAIVGQTDKVVTTKPDGWLGMFLTEPMGIYNMPFGSNNDLVAEVIGPASGSQFAVVNRYIVQLYPVPEQ
jgi:Flp pilus assembly protein TadG